MSGRWLQASLISVALLGALPAGAHAHVTLETKEAPIGASYKAVLRVPHGCEGSATIKVRVTVPEGFIGAKPMPKPGWTLETTRGPYAQSYPYYHGPVSEGVKEVVWSGRLPDDFFDEFVVMGLVAKTLSPNTTLHFPTVQECETGKAEWTQIPAPGQDRHSVSHPAPGLKLLPAQHQMATASPTTKAGDLVIEAPWARATPAGARVGGAYLKITNTGKEPDRLIGGSFPLAQEVEVHEMAMTDNVMKMRRLDGLVIKPGETVELKPGSYHLMFMGLREGLKEGAPVKGTLVFEKAGSVSVEYRIVPIGASQGPGHSHH